MSYHKKISVLGFALFYSLNYADTVSLINPSDISFTGYYPNGCIVSNSKAGVGGTCECIQDTKTHKIWLATPSHGGMSWNYDSQKQTPGASDWVNALNSGGVCGFTSGWELPTEMQINTILGYAKMDKEDNAATWLNNHGFNNIDENGYYWGASIDNKRAYIGVVYFGKAGIDEKDDADPTNYAWAVHSE
jgi:hypothetical protein